MVEAMLVLGQTRQYFSSLGHGVTAEETNFPQRFSEYPLSLSTVTGDLDNVSGET